MWKSKCEIGIWNRKKLHNRSPVQYTYTTIHMYTYVYKVLKNFGGKELNSKKNICIHTRNPLIRCEIFLKFLLSGLLTIQVRFFGQLLHFPFSFSFTISSPRLYFPSYIKGDPFFFSFFFFTAYMHTDEMLSVSLCICGHITIEHWNDIYFNVILEKCFHKQGIIDIVVRKKKYTDRIVSRKNSWD